MVDRRLPLLATATAVAALVLSGARGVVAQSATRSIAADTSVITDQLIRDGRGVFRGHGGCAVCHGQKLEGVVGPTLKAHAWKDAPNGDFDALIRVISAGVPNTVMVAHPNGISQAQVVAVAAYIWAVNHGRTKP